MRNTLLFYLCAKFCAMNILLLGGGGREHAFAWKIRQSPLCKKLLIAPGNAGMQAFGTLFPIDPNDFEAVKQLVLSAEIDMVVVGPEEPLVRGIYDFFKQDDFLRHIAVIGPSAAGAQLEGSKAFAKQFMQEFGIPTAAYREFTLDTLDEGLSYIENQPLPIVLKADGLAAGKGVLICETTQEAQQGFREMLAGKFGVASAKVVVEQFLKGIEFSVFVITDGKSYRVLPVAKDYKRVGEGDTGLNTGGMGAVSPVPFVDQALMQKVEERIIRPTIQGIQQRGLVYEGFLFLGLIRVGDEPFVIEYNCRMGDPETEVVLPRLKSDLVAIMRAASSQQLAEVGIEEEARAAATVMLVSGGYPEAYEKGKIISGLESVENSIVFHAGTLLSAEKILTNGGRVLAVTSYGHDVQEALRQSYQNISKIDFENKYYRKDIGFDIQNM